MLGNLYLFLSKLIEETKPAQQSNEKKDDYIQKKAITFIEMNYSRQITIQEIANHICLNRSYFSDLFKQHLGISPQQFIIKYRINKAREMIKQHQYLSIGNIARSIGYADQFAFSKTFRKETGLSPSALRKQLSEKGN